uniref:Uncharacterized protein n=1 Tax=Anguilla anguilla TaxID=7936 RepID=A0A0E9PC43_ANGAN
MFRHTKPKKKMNTMNVKNKFKLCEFTLYTDQFSNEHNIIAKCAQECL